MDQKLKNLFDEQQQLAAEIKEQIKSDGAAKIVGFVISVMNLMEGVIGGKRRENIITKSADTALTSIEKLISRLKSGDEKTILIAEGLSAKSLGDNEAEWGRKIARVVILGEYLRIQLAKAAPAFAMMSEMTGKNLWSDLQKLTTIELGMTDFVLGKRSQRSESRWTYRRARSSVDGLFPVYAVIAKQRFPLMSDQCEKLDREALDLAERPAVAIRSIVEEMLDADKSGNEHGLEIAGFLREQSPYNGSRNKTSISAPLACDQCGRGFSEVGFFLDACTIDDMKWCWMCPPCFFALGCGVGQGFGQLYLHERSESFLILGQERPNSWEWS